MKSPLKTECILWIEILESLSDIGMGCGYFVLFWSLYY